MNRLFSAFKEAKPLLKDDTAVLMFSGGRDSIVMLDIANRIYSKVIGIHKYIIKGLEYKEKVFRYYQKKYNFKLYQMPNETVRQAFRQGGFTGHQGIKVKNTKDNADEAYARKVTGHDYLFYGFRMGESLSRRGLIRDGGAVNTKWRKVYPLAEWSQREIKDWVEKNNLLLMPEYSYGFRDISSFCGETAVWLKDNYPNDYRKAVSQFPYLDGEIFRERNR